MATPGQNRELRTGAFVLAAVLVIWIGIYLTLRIGFSTAIGPSLDKIGEEQSILIIAPSLPAIVIRSFYPLQFIDEMITGSEVLILKKVPGH